MDDNFMLLGPRWCYNPDCWDVGLEVVSFLRSCLAGNLGDWSPRVGGAEPEFLVEEGLEMIAELSSFLLWFLLILVIFL